MTDTNASTTTRRAVLGVHLVGSMPLEDEEAVFRTASAKLGQRASRIPDGETGDRTNWVFWQAQVFEDSDDFVSFGDPDEYGRITTFVLRDRDKAEVEIGRLGYAVNARRSYETFARLKAEGAIAAGVRFQVSIPTAVAVVSIFVVQEDRARVEASYEAALREELAEIVCEIPARELAVQFDVAVEFGILEGAVFVSWWEDTMPGIVSRLVSLGDAVPNDVELGYHLCYGDAGHQHFVQPKDAAFLADVAQAVSDGLHRRVDFVHLPVPRGRTDAAYFAPLADLSLAPETTVYLGLLHATDGIDGANARIAAATTALQSFGIAAECGFGRRSPESVASLLDLHAAVADAHAEGSA